jgi:four helix bundle protein
MYGITSQLRRASVSIVLNIAEGAARRASMGSDAGFRRFLNMSIGSLSEVDTLILLCEDLSYVSPERSQQLQSDLEGISRPLHGLWKSLKH